MLGARLLGAATGASEALVARLAPWSDVRAQGRVTDEAAHRPWPLPDGPWIQGQTWVDLLFAHWEVDPAALRAAVPAQLAIDTFDGRAWLGVTPFQVRGLRLRGTLPAPRASRFAETNVRTYVSAGDRPGIWFFSLDAASLLAVVGARATYRLPYHHASIELRRDDATIDYGMRRLGGPTAALRLRYRPTGPAAPPAQGTLEHFLTERYCLYALDARGGLLRAEIHHPPWPLQPAAADIALNTMAAPLGLELAGRPLAHFAARQDVVIWPPRPAA